MLLLTWCIFRHGKNRFLHDILPISNLFIYDPGFRINQSVMFLVFQNFSLKIKLFWLLHLLSHTHCVLLKHYYSVDFPWFDIKLVSLVSSAKLGNWKKKVVKWQKFKTALCDLTEKLFLLNFVSLQFWTEISYQSGSQIHAWILLKKKFYYISFYSSFCRTSPFHRELFVLIDMLMI